MKPRRRTSFCFVLLIVVFICQPVGGQPADKYAEPIKTFEEFVKTQMEADRSTGLSVAFMKDDFVWAKGYGFADLENKVPATEKSAYRLASVTKPMTATAIMQLVEKGKINLDAEVQTYVLYFPKKPWPVTVRQLLGHLGGISHYKNEGAELHIKEHENTREAIAIFQDFDLVAEPGTRYSYSSLYNYPTKNLIVAAATNFENGISPLYAQRLIELILDEPVIIRAYAGDKINFDLLAGIANVYSDGLVYFEKTQKPVTINQAELAEAFAYFNKNVNRTALQADYKGASQKIRDGRHPAAGQPFAKIGSIMAAKLQEKFGTTQVDAYRRAGPIPFFADYITTYKKEKLS